MSKAVVHIDTELHERVKAHCVSRGLMMGEFVSRTIGEALDRAKKPLPKLDQPLSARMTNEPEPWERPAFYEVRR